MHPAVRRFIEVLKRNPAVSALIVLDFFGFLLFLKSGPSASGFLGFISLIALTMSYFFLKGTLLSELEQHVVDIEAHPGSYDAMMNDLARVSKAVLQLDEMARDIANLKEGIAELQAIKEGLSALKQDIAQYSALQEKVGKLSEKVSKLANLGSEVVKLREAVVGMRTGRAPSKGGASAQSADAASLQEEVANLREKVEQLIASQPNLEIVLHEAKLTSQVDRTLIECTLSIKNHSNRPNEVVAVRAELDCGRGRMTPTSIRHWLPEGMDADEDRKVVLPLRVDEKSSTPKIQLTATGWPLDKNQKSCPLRITIKDKDGNEFSHMTELKPEEV